MESTPIPTISIPDRVRGYPVCENYSRRSVGAVRCGVKTVCADSARESIHFEKVAELQYSTYVRLRVNSCVVNIRMFLSQAIAYIL
jgi:hypothetical protein